MGLRFLVATLGKLGILRVKEIGKGNGINNSNIFSYANYKSFKDVNVFNLLANQP